MPVLRAVITRIARARRRGKTEIHDPLAYVARVIQDVRLADKLTAEERELAASVALVEGNHEIARATEEKKHHRREEEARKRGRGYEWFFDSAPDRSPPEQPAEGTAQEPDPWEGSLFAGVVPPECWWDQATSHTAGAIQRRMVELAAAGDAEEYLRAREELYAAPWVGDQFKERVIARCDELIRREETEGRTPRGGDHG